MASAIQCLVRVRPFLASEVTEHAKRCVSIPASVSEAEQIEVTSTIDGQKFTYFLKTCRQNAKQLDVCAFTSEFVSNALLGEHVCILITGSKLSGKSYSCFGNPMEPGVVPVFVQELFKRISENKTQRFRISVSAFEVRDQSLVDLLSPNFASSLTVAHNPNFGSYVPGLCNLLAATWAEADRFLAQARLVQQSLLVQQPDNNSRSDRPSSSGGRPSSSGGRPKATSGGGGGGGSTIIMLTVEEDLGLCCRIMLGEITSEAAPVRTSGGPAELSEFGSVVQAAAQHRVHDSAMGRLLEDALGGNCHTLLLGTVAPTSQYFDETKHTLDVLAAAAAIPPLRGGGGGGRVTPNFSRGEAAAREVRGEIEKVRRSLLGASAGGGSQMKQALAHVEGLMRDLEYIKKQSYQLRPTESERMSEERTRCLTKAGLFELVMNVQGTFGIGTGGGSEVKGDDLDRKRLKQLVMEAKAEAAKSKALVKQLKGKYVEDLTAFRNESNTMEQDVRKEGVRKIEYMKKSLMKENELMKTRRKKYKDLKSQLGEGAKTQSNLADFYDEEHLLERAVAESARRKTIAARRMLMQSEEERQLGYAEAEKINQEGLAADQFRPGGKGATREDLLRLAEQLGAEVANRDHFQRMKKYLLEESEISLAGLEESWVNYDLDLRRHRQNSMQVFRRYRQYFEADKERMERHYHALTQRAIGNAIQLANQSAKMEQQLELLENG